ncbi:MAG: Holliday junction resolvase-like protein [Candidatus Aenigmatarchaeota archaeon]
MFVLFLIAILSILLIYLFFKNLEWRFRFEEKVRKYIQEKEEEIRRDAIERSYRIISGKVSERLAPLLREFPYNPKDARWIGDPIDLVVFDGLSEGKLRKIVFVEVKTGKSNLNKNEREVREVLKKREVMWKEVRI